MPPPLEVLRIDTEECWKLLCSADFGRVAVTIDAMPVVLPVFYAVADDAVLFRTVPGTKLEAATAGTVVAFEVDAFDPRSNEGWSVVVQGVASEVPDPGDLDRFRAPHARVVAADAAADRYVRIPATVISGRLLRMARDDADEDVGSP